MLGVGFHPVAGAPATPASIISLSTAREIISKLPPKIVEELDLTGPFERAGAEVQAGMSVRLNQVVVVLKRADL